MHASGGTTQGAKVVGAFEWVGARVPGYGNRFLKLSGGCMVTQLKVLEFFSGLEFFRTCAR